MEYETLHTWDVPINEAVRMQRELRERLILTPPADFAPHLVAGADLSTTRFSPTVYAGFVVLNLEDMTPVDEATAICDITFPYVPGLLSFREIPALIEAWKRLATRPDVLVLDGHGTAHPRRMGIACHAGLVFNLPTLGCAKSILTGRHDVLGQERGALAPIIDRGEIIGMAVRTRTGVSPVYVSPGHLMDLDTAVSLILQLTSGGKYRQPETTRRAHRLVNEVRIAHRHQ